MFLSFRKNKETKCISVQISKKFKRPAVSLSKMCRLKIFVTYQNFLRTLDIHYKTFDNSHLKFRKKVKAKIKKQHVRRPVLTSVGFLKSWFCNFSRNITKVKSIWMSKRRAKFNFLQKVDGLFQRFPFECNLQNTIRTFENDLGEIHDFCSFKDIRQSHFHGKLFKCK